MNATSLEELRAGPEPAEVKDERMELVRQLLLGDHQRAVEARFDALEKQLEQHAADIARQLEAMSQRLEALAGETEAARRTAFDELSRHIMELGERIRTFSQN